MEISQLNLRDLFADPGSLYEQMFEKLSRRKQYQPKVHTEFDAELVATGWTSMGCALLCVMVHHRKQAFPVMLDSEDLSSMRESLAGIQISLNTAELLKAGVPNPVFGFGL